MARDRPAGTGGHPDGGSDPDQRDNGRDHAADALQEALDGAVYCEAMGRRDLAAEFLGLAGKLMGVGDAG